jgi:lysophospholipase L1-like esterase
MGRRLRPPLAAFIFICATLLAASISASPAQVSAQEPPRYIALGDSLTFGVGASEPNQAGFVALVHDALERSERFAGTGIDLINLSAPGATSPDLSQPGGQLQLAVNEIQHSADVPVITIGIGGNDLLALAGADSPCLDLATTPCQTALGEILSDLQTHLGGTLRALREAAPDASIVVVDLYNPFSGTGDIRELIADVGVQQINGVIGATAADPSLGAKLATVFQLFQGRGLQWISADGIHPNDDGYAVMAEVVLAALDDRQPAISEELLSVPSDPVSVLGSPPVTGNGDDVPLVALVIAIVTAFIAGGVVAGAFFVVRGR